MLVQCTCGSTSLFFSVCLSLSVLRPILIRCKPPGTLFRSLSSRSSISSGLYPARSMLSYPTDNSIILHAKTASDVLAQSASHLCEQITSYRKTDFYFRRAAVPTFLLARAIRPFSLHSISLSPLPPILLYYSPFSLNVVPYRVQCTQDKIGTVKLE